MHKAFNLLKLIVALWTWSKSKGFPSDSLKRVLKKKKTANPSNKISRETGGNQNVLPKKNAMKLMDEKEFNETVFRS